MCVSVCTVYGLEMEYVKAARSFKLFTFVLRSTQIRAGMPKNGQKSSPVGRGLGGPRGANKSR